VRPNTALTRAAGVVMVLGLVFLIIGADPVVNDFAGTDSADEKLQILLASPDAWDHAMTWFAIAALPIAIGFALWALAVQRGDATTRSVRVATGGAVAAIVGSAAWIALCYARATRDPVDVARDQNIGWWSSAFEPLVMLAVGLLGFLLLRAGMTKRGWTVIGIAVLFTVVGLILPLVIPIVVAAAGLLLVLTRTTSWSPSG
jgi:hypothetical protein